MNMSQPIERRSSKSRLSKQDEVEELEEDTSPCSDMSDATVVAANEVFSEEIIQNDSPEPSECKRSPELTSNVQSDNTDDERDCNSPSFANSRVKLLVRSEAVRDDSSPPPDQVSNNNNLNKLSAGTKLDKDDSEGSEHLSTPVLSRDSSIELAYTDSTGVDLEDFIRQTLNKNPKDRMTLFNLEREMSDFIKSAKTTHHKFSQMSSYHRMLVHRVAAFFGLDHNVDSTGKCVIVNTTPTTRIPDFKFKDHIICEDGSQDELPPRRLLRREGHSADEGRGYRQYSLNGKKSKSFEEREEEYHKVRERIFRKQDSQSSQEGVIDSPVGSKAGSRHHSARNSREELRWGETRPWSSTESSGYGTDTSGRHLAPRANSTGGISNRNRFTSSGTQDSMSSASSSLGSPMSRPPTIPCSPPPGQEGYPQMSSPQNNNGLPSFLKPGQVFWATSDIDAVPPGSILINPENGCPYTNPDGSTYIHPGKPVYKQQKPAIQQLPPPVIQQTQQVAPPVYQQYTHHTPPMLTVERKQYSQESVGGPTEINQQFTGMMIQAQNSVDSLPDMSPGGQPVQYQYVINQQSVPPQQGAPQQGYVQQMPYYQQAPPTSSSQPVRYVYSVQYPPQGQTSVEGQGQQVQPTTQYSSQPPPPTNFQTSYVMSYPSQTSENYPQTQTGYSSQAGYHIQTESPEQSFPQYNSSHVQQGYYNNVPSSSNGTPVITYVSQPAGQTSYRPPSPSQQATPYISYNYQPPTAPLQSQNHSVVPFASGPPQQGVATVVRPGNISSSIPLPPGGQFQQQPVMSNPASQRMPLPETKDCTGHYPVIYSNPNPMVTAGDPRLMGPAVGMNMMVRAQSHQMYAPRQRLPSPSNSKVVKPQFRGQKGWSSSPSSSKDSANQSPHTSTDSSECGGNILEVCEFVNQFKGHESDSLFDELVQQGVQMQYFRDNRNITQEKDNMLLSECAVYAICENDVVAQNLLANHRSRSYKLRLLQRSSEVDVQS